ncbi:MAG: TlpA family protein disulfide reductase [Chitinophagales bacterium]
MNKQFILLIALVALLFACQNATDEETPIIDAAIFTGTIENRLDDTVKIMVGNETLSAVLDENNSFRFDIDNMAHDIYTFRNGRQYGYTYLGGTDSVYLSLDAADFDFMQEFSGDLSAENTAYLKMNQFDWNMDRENLYASDAENFSLKADEIGKDYRKTFENLSTENADFAKKLDRIVDYKVANMKFDYPYYHKSFTQNEAELNEGFYDFAKKMEFENDNLLGSSDYDRFLVNYFDKIVEDSEKEGLTAHLELLDLSFENEQIKGQLISSYFRYSVIGSSTDELAKLTDYTEKYVSDASQKEDVLSLVEKAKSLAAGLPSPSIMGEDIKGTEVNVLSSTKGKVTYIDCWASWCAPCKREMPYLKELEEEYGDRINVVKLSMDDDYDDWFAYLEEQNMIGKGYNLISKNAFDSEFALAYGINSIPRFILLDADGHIVDADAERPSGDIRTDIDALLN